MPSSDQRSLRPSDRPSISPTPSAEKRRQRRISPGHTFQILAHLRQRRRNRLPQRGDVIGGGGFGQGFLRRTDPLFDLIEPLCHRFGALAEVIGDLLFRIGPVQFAAQLLDFFLQTHRFSPAVGPWHEAPEWRAGQVPL
ncbi:hypothetical protein [Paenirhodobacter sp.]|uniref:hypothetical protein n=1 Tax=Paenirhodobacter sp. TaxID=1965326 RepID=UPI003B3FC4ED